MLPAALKFSVSSGIDMGERQSLAGRSLVQRPFALLSRVAGDSRWRTHSCVPQRHSCRCLGLPKIPRRRQERGTIQSGTSMAPQTLRRAGDGGRACQWRAHPRKHTAEARFSCLSFPGEPGSQHSCVPCRHSPQTSLQAVESTGGPTSVWGRISSCGRFSIGPRADACHKGLWRQRRSRRGSTPALGDASVFSAANGSDTSGERSLRERFWHHKPSAMPNRMAVDSGGARTRACRVGTHADTQLSGSPKASARVPTRHARVRAPRRAPAYFQWFAGRFVESGDAARMCATNLGGKRRREGRLKIGRRIKSCPTTDFSTAVFPVACREVSGECRCGLFLTI